MNEDSESALTDAKYGFISGALKETFTDNHLEQEQTTKVLDSIVTHRIWGYPIFFLFMYLMFEGTFVIGEYPMMGIEWLVEALGNLIRDNMSEGPLKDLMIDGIIGGVGGVIVFLPNILILYFCISLMEDSGYMARAAFVMDRLMQALGLPGKSFVPLIVGFGCNVPSIMGARTLDAPRERLITVLMAPFMSCGARLAIFAVFAAAFFGKNGASVVFSLYLLGIVVAILTGLLLKHTLMRGEASPFVMELPVYHVPHTKTLLIQTWQRLKGFVVRAGKVIVVASIFIGALNSFSLSGKPVDNINDSALASVSKVITPVLQPIGVHSDNWQATVGLITGAMAKEVVVGTLNTLYTAEAITSEPFDAASFDLLDELESAVADTWDSLKETFSISALSNPIEASMGDAEMATGSMGTMAAKFGSDIAAYSYLIFVLLYVPCVSVMGAIARETNKSWMTFSILWGLNVAYSLAALFYQTATFNEHPQSSLITISAVIIFNIVLITVLRRVRSRVTFNIKSKTAQQCSGCSNNSCH